MTDEEISRLKELAARFRVAILRTDPDKRPITMRHFPLGSCGDANLLLAKFLQENGFSGIDYVCGNWGRESHAWLEIGEVVVDIAADQFADAMVVLPAAVITNRAGWYSEFEEKFRHPADIDSYDEYARRQLLKAYEEITAHLPPPGPLPSQTVYQ